MQIAIDGPAGAGKSTIAKIIAKELNILYLDTGAMYRAITYGVLKNDIDFSDESAIIDFAENAMIAFEGEEVFLNGESITLKIRTPEINQNISKIACMAPIRKILVREQRRIAEGCSVIMDGRDIGSVVLPNADYKFYLDASVEERTMRRMIEFKEKNVEQDFEAVKQDIIQRDYNDMHRETDPLICTEDAIVVDTTGMSIQEVCDRILSYISED